MKKYERIWFYISPYKVKFFTKIKIDEALTRYFDMQNKTVVGKVIIPRKSKLGLESDRGYLFSRKINQLEIKR